MSHQKGFTQIFILIVLFAGLAVGFYLVQNKQLFFSHANSPKTPLKNLTTITTSPKQMYGFNTHLTTGKYGYYENLDINTFKSNVDELVGKNIGWIRFSLNSGEIAPTGDTKTIQWNEQSLEVYSEAIDYAKTRGLIVYLATDVPFFAKSYPLGSYKKVVQNYYTKLASQFTGKVGMWQIFNEADTHTYNEYKAIDDTQLLDSNYLYRLRDIVSTAKRTIRKYDQKVPLTMNVSGYPLSAKERTYDRWVQFFDVLGSELDWYALDMYPDKDPNGQQLLIQRTNDISSKYHKNVAVAEIGICTANFSETDQATFIPQYVQALKQSQAKLVLLYEYQDEGSGSSCEQSFGFKKVDGSYKTAYEPVMQTLFPITISPLPTPSFSPCYPCDPLPGCSFPQQTCSSCGPMVCTSPSPTPSPDCCSTQLKQQGYQCIQQCGPPVVRSTDPTPPYSCMSPEQVVNRQRFGCPI